MITWAALVVLGDITDNGREKNVCKDYH
jgi:hypothetical protein